MSEALNWGEGPQVETYDLFSGDKEASRELLGVIREQYRQELDRSGFTRRFIDALGPVDLTDPDAQLYVADLQQGRQ